MSDDSIKEGNEAELVPKTELNEANGVQVAGEHKENNESTDDTPSASAGSYGDYEKYISYADDGTAIYTDPATSYQYIFDTEKNQWVPKDGNSLSSTGETNIYETEHYRWCKDTKKWLLRDGVTDAGENPYENEHYIWNPETNKWDAKTGDQRFATSVYVDGQHLYTDSDGAIFFWDEEKKAWFPKIDDDFLAIYQTNYGFIDNTTKEPPSQPISEVVENKAIEEDSNKDEQSTALTGKRKAQPAQWFEEDPSQCTKVYVSNLPDDITEEEFIEVMAKVGMIFRDPKTKKMKVKLYAEPNGQLKGDGLVHYIRIESVQMAIDLLDGYEVKGRKIKVQRAKFQMRGTYNPSLKPKKNKKDKESEKKLQTKLLDWRPDPLRGERGKHERVVILKNMFEPKIFENNVDLIMDYQNNLREECSKCGTVKKVIVYCSEPEGVCEVRMNDPEEADLVVQMMHKRYFGSRMLTAELWDGITKFKKNETDDENIQRLSKWSEFLEQGDDDDEKPKSNTAPSTAEVKAE